VAPIRVIKMKVKRVLTQFPLFPKPEAESPGATKRARL